MPDSLTGFIQGEYDYLRSREGGDFFLALAPYVNALHDRSEIREILAALETEMREALDRVVAEQNAMIEEAKSIRAELAARAPEIDNSDMEQPDPGSHAYGVWRYNSFAGFDAYVRRDATLQIGYPAVPGDRDDPGVVSVLLQILRGRLRAAVYGEGASITDPPIRDDLEDLARRIGNLDEQHRASVQRYRQESRTLPGLAYARLSYFGTDLVADPVKIDTDEEVEQFLDRSIREWGKPKTIARQLVNGERLEDWEERSIAETEESLKDEAARLHQELLRRLPSSGEVVRTLAVPPLPAATTGEARTLAAVTEEKPLSFTEFVELMLARVAEADRESPGAFIDLFALSEALKQDVPDDWVYDALSALEDRGLTKAQRAFGRRAEAKLTGDGRLYVEQGGGTGVIEEYRRQPANFVIVAGSGHQVAVGTQGDVSQTSIQIGVPPEAWELLDQIEDGLKADESIDESERGKALQDVQTAREQLERPEPNKRAAAAVLDPLAKISSIASFVTRLAEILI